MKSIHLLTKLEHMDGQPRGRVVRMHGGRGQNWGRGGQPCTQIADEIRATLVDHVA